MKHSPAPQALYEWVSISGKILGTLFYYSPADEQVQSILPLFLQADWQWGDIELSSDIRAGLEKHDQLEEHYQDLFIGPNEMAAPPWGSVYLDKESVFFGESTLALQAFMREHQINLLSDLNEPADHIGLMLMMAAYVAEEQPEVLPILLEVHLLPWVYRYLDLLSAQQDYPFYCALAKLAQLTIKDWQQQFDLSVPTVKLYR